MVPTTRNATIASTLTSANQRMYFVNWAMTGIVDITAVALYMHYWGAFGDVPQWVPEPRKMVPTTRNATIASTLTSANQNSISANHFTEFLGEKAAYVAGWMYFVNWAMTGIVDITAVALYMRQYFDQCEPELHLGEPLHADHVHGAHDGQRAKGALMPGNSSAKKPPTWPAGCTSLTGQ
jgi:L-asparagine transporter-like permease